MPRSPRRAGAVVAASVLCAGLTACGDEVAESSDCAATLVHDGRTYLGSGDLRREPEVTGRSLPAVLPGCDDIGERSGAEEDAPVRAEELVGVDSGTAVLVDGSLYVREGRDLPAHARRWFRAPLCRTPGTFELTGDWLGVTGSRRVRFDGDIRPPYRLEVRVTSGPARYVATTVQVRATATTDPALTPADVATSLWQDGQVTASVRCSDGHFEALGLRTR